MKIKDFFGMKPNGYVTCLHIVMGDMGELSNCDWG